MSDLVLQGGSGGSSRRLSLSSKAAGSGSSDGSRAGVWRGVLADSVTEKDMRAVIRALVSKAKAGEPWAVKEFLDRMLGRPATAQPEQDEKITGVQFFIRSVDDPPYEPGDPGWKKM